MEGNGKKSIDKYMFNNLYIYVLNNVRENTDDVAVEKLDYFDLRLKHGKYRCLVLSMFLH